MQMVMIRDCVLLSARARALHDVYAKWRASSIFAAKFPNQLQQRQQQHFNHFSFVRLFECVPLVDIAFFSCFGFILICKKINRFVFRFDVVAFSRLACQQPRLPASFSSVLCVHLCCIVHTMLATSNCLCVSIIQYNY